VSDANLPEGFRWTWHGDTVRVDLPEMTLTESHAYEPVLSRADADRLADAISGHVASHRGAPKLARVVLVKDPRFADASVQKFRQKLSVALIELSIEPAFSIESATQAPAVPPASEDIETVLESLDQPAAGVPPEAPPPAAPEAAPPVEPGKPEKKRDRPDWRERFGKKK
jgi:hypothetical protein